MLSTFQIGILVVLFVVFLGIPMLTKNLGSTLDSLPIRFAAILVVIAAIGFDRLIAIAVFLIICAIYIQHHSDSVQSVLGSSQAGGSSIEFPVPHAMKSLETGGHTSITYDDMDFMPKGEDQSNHFSSAAAAGASFDEKRVLPTEPLGTRAQNLFPEDQGYAGELMRGNQNGSRAGY